MTIATEKVKASTSRFVLVRLTPARYVGGDLSSAGSGVYTMTFPYPIAKVERNGAVLTEVTALASNDQWMHDESTGTLSVKLAAAPSATTNVIVVFYYLFYSSADEGVSCYENPDDTTTTMRWWAPKVLESPTVRHSFSGIDVGVFTISDATIALLNADSEFQDYLGSNDSFYNKAADVWLCLNGVDNRQRIYTGKVTSIPEVSRERVRLSLVDQFGLLMQPALMGDDSSECYALTSVPPKDLGKPIPLILSERSYHRTTCGTLSTMTYGAIAEGLEGHCSSFNADITTSNNRTWTLCRTNGSIKQQSFGSITRATTDFISAYFYFASTTNVAVGDTISWVEAAVTYYATVVGLGDFTYSGNTYNLWAMGASLSASTASTMSSLYSLSLIIKGDSAGTLWPMQGRDFTVSTTTTAGSHKLVKAVFQNNFEASLSMSTLDPNTHTVEFRLENSASLIHGTVLKRMLEKAGCTVNATSINDANSALADYAAFSIPNIDETDYSEYAKYCGDLLGSTLGYVFINASDEVEYKLLSAPSASTDSRDTTNVNRDSVAASIEYQDILTQITPENPHLPIITNSAYQVGDQVTSNKARYLHGVVNSIKYRHVLKYNGTALNRAQYILDLRSNRRATYRYKTQTVDAEALLGDSVSLTSDQILGGSGSDDVKIVSVEKGTDGVSVEATDMLGL